MKTFLNISMLQCPSQAGWIDTLSKAVEQARGCVATKIGLLDKFDDVVLPQIMSQVNGEDVFKKGKSCYCSFAMIGLSHPKAGCRGRKMVRKSQTETA